MQLSEIGQLLGNLYKERAQYSFADWQVGEDLKARKLFLTPAEGWQGKNAEQREVESARVFASDAACRNMLEMLITSRGNLYRIEGEISALEAERRALEWKIRADLVEALIGKRNETDGNAVEQAFDDALQNAADDELDKSLEEMSNELMDDLPF